MIAKVRLRDTSCKILIFDIEILLMALVTEPKLGHAKFEQRLLYSL
ncbi:hypothetical protein PPEP_a1990 [Pseudoalteromonas peptidolytica F12-50-A1]|uniref:Uncharacterized protein n=1 Tax=Pseudoalteromonas peptidolytica F12-50-A1 TaxID=1315280 RepID=A0A8I0T4Z2_9GAMM|nr:hypothetical protein [Pseudoalteromonas peptidolytica F12-50-A1]